MDRNIDQTREQVEHPQDAGRRATRGLKHIAAGVALLGMTVAGLAGLQSGAGGVPRAAHASSYKMRCARCTLLPPTITASYTQLDPLTLNIVGTDFTPGGAVHVDLMVAYVVIEPTPTPAGPDVTPVPGPTPSPDNESEPQIVASMDTTASYASGVGLVYHDGGGRFATTLAASSSHLRRLLLLAGRDRPGDGQDIHQQQEFYDVRL